MNCRRRVSQARLHRGLALVGLSLMSAAGTAWLSSVTTTSADETTGFGLPLSSRLTGQAPAASLRISSQRLPSTSETYLDEARSNSFNTVPDSSSAKTNNFATAAATELVVEDGSTPAVSFPATLSPAASSPAVSSPAVSSPAVSSPAVSSPAARLESSTTQVSSQETAAGSLTNNSERSVIRATTPSRLPRTTPTIPVRLPPVESGGSLPYGEYQRPPVRVGSEVIPAPATSNGQLPPPYPSRLPSTGPVTGMPANTPQVGGAVPSDATSSRWQRFKSQAQYDFWGYPEQFCERPLGLPNQLAYQAMVDNARDDLLVFHQYDFHDGHVESAANLNGAGMRRVDRVAELLRHQAGGSTVIVEFVPDQPRLTDARREEVAAQLGRYGLHEPAVRVAVGRARRGVSGREAQGIQRTFDRMTGASALSGAVGGMNASSGGMGSSGGSSGGMSGGGMSGNQGSGMMGNGAGGLNGNSGPFGY